MRRLLACVWAVGLLGTGACRERAEDRAGGAQASSAVERPGSDTDARAKAGSEVETPPVEQRQVGAGLAPEGTGGSGDAASPVRPGATVAGAERPVRREVLGYVEEVQGREILLRIPGEPPVVLTAVPHTDVLLGGEERSLEVLSPGTEVRAAYLVEPGSDGDRGVAEELYVRGGVGAGPAQNTR